MRQRQQAEVSQGLSELVSPRAGFAVQHEHAPCTAAARRHRRRACSPCSKPAPTLSRPMRPGRAPRSSDWCLLPCPSDKRSPPGPGRTGAGATATSPSPRAGPPGGRAQRRRCQPHHTRLRQALPSKPLQDWGWWAVQGQPVRGRVGAPSRARPATQRPASVKFEG